jgi:hypothetical protein
MRAKSLMVLAMIAMAAVGGVLSSSRVTVAQSGPRIGQPAPDITGGPWINSEPLSMEKLRGRVVFVEFWTYG